MTGEKISVGTHHILLRSVKHKQKQKHVTYSAADSPHLYTEGKKREEKKIPEEETRSPGAQTLD